MVIDQEIREMTKTEVAEFIFAAIGAAVVVAAFVTEFTQAVQGI